VIYDIILSGGWGTVKGARRSGKYKEQSGSTIEMAPALAF